ncbi:hypothetical protein Gohar_009271 [Gossypium harknessii]|uniref:Cytochrome P450 n=1 Tax=Gossypium harknessii TaxID=34285 RepID=A0A7J9GMB1_9ROSI|nr:hypothetical protein [Gossypium harknessii]
MGIPPPQLEAGSNKIIWAGSSNGSFSIKSAYWRIREGSWNPKNDSGLATIGGILRYKHGRWILGYTQFVGICSILDAELLGILEGLAIAIDRGFDRVFILSDSQKAVQVVQESATRQVTDDHLVSRPTKHDEKDIVDVLLRMEKDQTQNDSIQLTKDHIKAILMDIFVSGIDTGAITMIWAMTELVRKPTAMKKAQNEIRSCIRKKGKLTENDASKLKYLKMTIKETLRLHPPVVLLVPRETMSQIKIGNYDICSKTRIAVNVWAIGRDPDIWNNPEDFIPERFIDNPIDLKGQHFELLPFGAGRRIFPGMNMGMAVLELALANLLYCFDWKLPSGMTKMDIDMEEEVSITVGKKFPLMLMPINYNMWEDDEIKHC